MNERSGLTRRELLKRSGSTLLLGALASCLPRGCDSTEVRLANNRKLKVHFWFSKHSTAEEAMGIEPLLAKVKPHVAAIEGAFGTERRAREKEELYSSGPMNFREDHSQVEYELFKKHGVSHMFFLERFPEDEMERVYKEEEAKRTRDLSAFFEGRPQDAIDNHRKHLEIETEQNVRREKMVKDQLSNFYAILTKRFPNLKNEKEIRVVVSYGAAHTPIYKYGRSVGFGEVSRQMRTPTYYHLGHALSRRKTFGLKMEPTDLEVARALVAVALANYAFQYRGFNYFNANAYGNQVAMQMNLDHFRKASQILSQREPISVQDVPESLIAALAKQGIKVPKTREAIHEFLKRKLGEKRLVHEA